MKTRIIAGIIAAILLTCLIFWGPPYLVTGAVLTCAALSYLEYDRLFFPKKSITRQTQQLTFVFLTILAMQQSMEAGWISLWFATTILFVCHVLAPSRSGDFPKAVQDASLELLGYWYVIGLFGFLGPIAELPSEGRKYLLLLFLLVFGGDTAAYFAGSRWGKHTLAEKVSPKKSVEGAVAAVVTSILVTLGWLFFFTSRGLTSAYSIKLLVFAPFASVLAQFGDLFESVLKRSQSKKDSGSFLPGHGGILDRVDGLAIASPIFYFFVIYVLETA